MAAIPVDAEPKYRKVARFSPPQLMKDDKKLPSPQDAEREHLIDLAPHSDLPPDADLEDRFNDFWKKNGPTLFGVIAVIAVIVVGYQVYDYMQERNAARRAAEFSALETSTDKLEFAQQHPDTHLGGLAYLEIADEAYAAGNFTDALERYDAAQQGLEGTPVNARARLGAAMARLQLGNPDATALLDQVARDPEVLSPLRGEAAYLLAGAQWAAGNAEQARRALDLLDTLENATVWQRHGQQLEKLLPPGDEQ